MKRKIAPILAALALATLSALLFRLLLVENYWVESNAMAPVLREGEMVLVTKFNFSFRLPFSTYEIVKFRRPELFEVVAFTLPYQSGETYIQRVVAREGDSLAIKGGVLYVNGTPQGERNLGMKDYGPVDIPPEHFFALNDNRSKDNDSRLWGPIPYSCLKGRAALIWFGASDRRTLWVNG